MKISELLLNEHDDQNESWAELQGLNDLIDDFDENVSQFDDLVSMKNRFGISNMHPGDVKEISNNKEKLNTIISKLSLSKNPKDPDWERKIQCYNAELNKLLKKD